MKKNLQSKVTFKGPISGYRFNAKPKCHWREPLSDRRAEIVLGREYLVGQILESSIRRFDLSEQDLRFQYKQLMDNIASSEVLNANLFDHFMKHQEVIPSHWRDDVCFWGTIFRNPGGEIYVRKMWRARGFSPAEWVGDKFCIIANLPTVGI